MNTSTLRVAFAALFGLGAFAVLSLLFAEPPDSVGEWINRALKAFLFVGIAITAARWRKRQKEEAADSAKTPEL
ncbi:hypothetical protein [Nocardia arizonensis]|uniref:hypothetical protein n=1 Tax=Nocardia arizonensis TaxID=1141647 RepID=UPI0006D1F71E|nr:hypothetical protein [Nocardia arizonensis]